MAAVKMYAHIEESDVRRLMLNHSNKSIALMDYSKFDVLAVSQFAKIDEIDVVVTDEEAPEESVKILREADVHVDVVSL